MKVFVVYGSQSDEGSFAPLCDKLVENGHEVYFEVISAHRRPDHLIDTLKKRKYDVVIAGAGIAAALPGVAASKTDKPVFGVPVPAYFGGLDALASIQQMPFGVPVLTCPPDGELEIVKFLGLPQLKTMSDLTVLNIVLDPALKDEDFIKSELDRSMKFANEKNIELKISDALEPELPNIVFVTKKSDVKANDFCLHVPVMGKKMKNDPAKYLEVLEWTKAGGLWLGVNNTRNAIISFIKLSRKGA